MPGRNPSAAYHAFTGPLQQDISCISHDVLVASVGGRHELDTVHSLTLADGPILLTSDGLQLDVGLEYAIIRTGESGKNAYKVSTKAYAYAFRDDNDQVVVAYHWHPFGRSSYPEPHMHLPQGPVILRQKAHYPSGRVSLESVIRACISELGAEARRDDWDKVLGLNEGKFKLYRSWSEWPPPKPRQPDEPVRQVPSQQET